MSSSAIVSTVAVIAGHLLFGSSRLRLSGWAALSPPVPTSSMVVDPRPLVAPSPTIAFYRLQASAHQCNFFVGVARGCRRRGAEHGVPRHVIRGRTGAEDRKS